MFRALLGGPPEAPAPAEDPPPLVPSSGTGSRERPGVHPISPTAEMNFRRGGDQREIAASQIDVIGGGIAPFQSGVDIQRVRDPVETELL